MTDCIRRLIPLGSGATLAFVFLVLPAGGQEGGKGPVDVTIDGLKSATPADWSETPVKSKMRFKQFSLPAKGKDPAELIIFFFGPGQGGSADENIKRWKGFFQPPRGKSLDEVAKVDSYEVSGVPVTYLDVKGTYLSKEPPFAPNAKTIEKPDYRMLGIVFESKMGPYFIRVVGPDATVSQHKKAFDDWLKGFK